MTASNQYESLKTTYLSNASIYLEAIKHFKLEDFAEPGVKSGLAKFHYDMIMSCFPLYDMIAQVRIEF